MHPDVVRSAHHVCKTAIVFRSLVYYSVQSGGLVNSFVNILWKTLAFFYSDNVEKSHIFTLTDVDITRWVDQRHP